MTASSTWKERRIESAAIDVNAATDSRGLKIRLCNPMDVDSVRSAVVILASWLQRGHHHFGDSGELNMVRNLRKLVTLLEAHLS
jgi:hypothetical protein